MTRSRGFRPMRDLPTVGWLSATVAVALAAPLVPAPRWLMIHLLLLGAVSHAIVVWSQYFTDALLHARPDDADARRRTRRLALLNGGVVVVVAGVLGGLWPLTAAGASMVVLAVGAHGVALLRAMRRALPARFAGTVRFYVAASAMLPVGAALGVLMARGLPEPWHVRVVLAHAAVNVLGWMGLTVAGTLVTLWPTMLRTRIADGAERHSARALPVLTAGVLATGAGALLGSPPTAAGGLVLYLAGLLLAGRPFVAAARHRPPRHFPQLSVLAGVTWLVASVGVLAGAVATAQDWEVVHDRLAWFTPALAVGFGAQVLLGALSYLVPVALGGGATAVRAANAELDRGGRVRLALANGGLLVALLPVGAPVRMLATSLVLGALASFLPLLVLALRASRRARVRAEDRPLRSSDSGAPRPQVGGWRSERSHE